MQALKEKVYNHCCELVAANISRLQRQLDELKESMASETKSTAGDKYETGRAMIHIEQDNLRQQLSEAMLQKAAMDLIDIRTNPVAIGPGSLIKTNRGWFFLAISLGKVRAGEETVFAISPNSPLGVKMKGLQKHDATEVNGTKYMIEDIV